MITEEKIKKIQSYKTWSVKKKVDELLMEDSYMYADLGIDSTAAEKNYVKNIA